MVGTPFLPLSPFFFPKATAEGGNACQGKDSIQKRSKKNIELLP
jgi:hypothetical protein